MFPSGRSGSIATPAAASRSGSPWRRRRVAGASATSSSVRLSTRPVAMTTCAVGVPRSHPSRQCRVDRAVHRRRVPAHRGRDDRHVALPALRSGRLR
jgi:hypothetical protein